LLEETFIVKFGKRAPVCHYLCGWLRVDSFNRFSAALMALLISLASLNAGLEVAQITRANRFSRQSFQP
jgi:hypothetical protein